LLVLTGAAIAVCSDGRKSGSLLTIFWIFTVAGTKTRKAIAFTCLWGYWCNHRGQWGQVPPTTRSPDSYSKSCQNAPKDVIFTQKIQNNYGEGAHAAPFPDPFPAGRGRIPLPILHPSSAPITTRFWLRHCVGVAGLSQNVMFEQDSALAHQACKMVAFLDHETPDFMSPCCSALTR